MANSTVPDQPHTWEQGEDLIIDIVYKEADAGGVQVGVPLSKETHAVRMDIAPADGAAVFSFNSEDQDSLDAAGDSDNEATFPAETPGLIHIKVPRSLTLPGGIIGDALPATNTYRYDLFLRTKDGGTGTQRKLLKGTITVNTSVTLWA